METILELQRRYHEEKERLLDSMTKEAVLSKKSQKEQINSDHRYRQLLDRYLEVCGQLRSLYEDRDGLRKEEVSALSGPNEFTEFYSRLKSIKDFHRKHPHEITIPMSAEFDELDKLREATGEDVPNMAEFTDEEGYGRYLDLHECYEMYINLKGVDKIDYLTYVTTFDHLYEFPKERKNMSYKEYVLAILYYLDSYISRIKPLFDVSEEMDSVHKEFEVNWAEGTVPGWRKETSSALTHAGAHLDLSAFSSWEELASLGLDRLKSALMALGLKCGGTLEERSERLFSTKGKNLNELDPSLFAKSKPGKSIKNRDVEKQKEVAELEAQVYRLVSTVEEQRAATVENIQRKQARTEDERNESDDEHQSDDESDEESDIPYNPKNLPLGWDGKPIPYWLYKLHGLNITYNCEICGNFTYKGPKTFQKHFAESRHAYGMRCLGIPNTAHFANVTLIEDAIALWERIKKNKEADRWKPDIEEEFEDSIGNVINKKIYEDLQKQGVL